MMKERVGLPVTQNTDEDLTDDDTSYLKVVDGSNPVGITDFVLAPALRERVLEQGADVGDGKQNVTG
jgi:hypothetical protein